MTLYAEMLWARLFPSLTQCPLYLEGWATALKKERDGEEDELQLVIVNEEKQYLKIVCVCVCV